jgi:hypothetical protein
MSLVSSFSLPLSLFFLLAKTNHIISPLTGKFVPFAVIRS